MAMAIRVGCIGLGVLGARIAARLAEEGFPLMIYDASSEPIRYFILKTSADIADAPAMMAEACDVVITVLPTAAEVREVALGRSGLALAPTKRCVLVDMGTSGAAAIKALADELAPRGIPVIEAPVCGTPMDAKAGKLTIPVAGDDALIERCMPVFRALGERVLRTGPLGSANASAALAGYMRAASLLALGEALLIARRSGMAPQVLLEACNSLGALGPTVGDMLQRRIMTGRFDSGETIGTVVEQLDIALALAERAELSPQFAALCRELWKGAWRERGSEDDCTTIVRWLETASAKPPAAADSGEAAAATATPA
jgi:3-hydroxyisobutyrate dehydrogenase-like beta-hydroxyacid dehydrogenase